MIQRARSWSLIGAITVILGFMAFPAVAAVQQIEPPFFGPPNMNANTLPGRVDTQGTGPGTGEQAYPMWDSSMYPTGIFVQSPWRPCAHWGNDDFMIQAVMNAAAGKYDQFKHWGRSVVIDLFDGAGHPIGATYTGGLGWPNDNGVGILEKSDPTSDYYDQVLFTGSKMVNGNIQPVNVRLSLVEQSGYIGVANLASVATDMQACGAANKNTQIWIPMGKVDGKNTVIPDINGDGVADTDFIGTLGTPLAGASGPPIPTLTEWGLAAFTVILLILGLHYLRKRGFATPA